MNTSQLLKIIQICRNHWDFVFIYCKQNYLQLSTLNASEQQKQNRSSLYLTFEGQAITRKWQKHVVWVKCGFRLCRAMHLKSGTPIKPQQKSTTFASLPSIKPLPLKSSDLLEAWQKRSKTKNWFTFYAPVQIQKRRGQSWQSQ